MRKKKKERDFEAFGLSFMDCICCGFGAIILLFVLTKISKDSYVRNSRLLASNSHLNPKFTVSPEAETALQELEHQLREMRRERQRLENRMMERSFDLVSTFSDMEKHQETLANLENKLMDQELDKKVHQRVGDQLSTARQQLSAEMKRLLQSLPKPQDRIIGGIPVDSEYVVFIVDTSGSMRRQWTFVRRKIKETLEIYPPNQRYPNHE